MAYNTKEILYDKDGNPIPQYYNPTADAYEPSQGASGKLAVRASELETLLTALGGYVDGLEGKDFATQTTLAAILAKIIAAPATEAKQDSIITYVDGIEGVLGAAVALPSANTIAARLKDLLTGIVLSGGTNVIGKVGIDQTSGQNLVQIGGTITPTHSTVTVGTSSITALESNTSRKYALFINDSDTAIYLEIGGAASLNAGIRLNADGGSYEMSPNIGNLATGAVYAISSGASENLLVLEGV
jgi:hypothetical protein